ncbi:chloride channel protein 2-like isoform X2 [Cylas formicarius]|uniref:chloride channel protein 2-like isoform X2 n=1 Tax=Cylas formicarius TaxID=197179 RepID=UPI0029586E4B|nr:chloride channel protein 2-like isoform X2 [Cylas formicarius]
MSGKAKYLPPSQLYDSKYSTVQYFNRSLEDLYESLKEKKLADKRKQRELKKARRREFDIQQGKFYTICAKIWRNTFGQFGEDWIFLALLGIFVAIISYTIDQGIAMCGKARMMLYTELADKYFAKWVAWISVPVCLILWDVGITSLIAPKAVGSGVPQIKTCLRGVYLKEFLTFKVLAAKWMGITATIGSGMPLGKEGPLIQMSSIIVTKMSKFLSSFKSMYANENKKIELIGAAYAVGVACTFNAPVGGVLFSVEISTAYYAVRNYWRGFFAAVWGAAVYRLLYVWIDGADTIRVVFPTNFVNQFPYDPWELVAFAVLGVLCGCGGSFYIFCAKGFNRWLKNHKVISRIKECNRFAYPCFVVLLVSTVTWPPGIGQFMAADLTARDQVVQLFSDFSWTSPNHTVAQQDVLKHWTTRYTGIYANLSIFIWYQFVFSILAASMPIPCGTFIPNFRSGAAVGRIVGELMVTWFPQGVKYKGAMANILPGAYATVGASAWSGAVTHTLSTSVILFEMTSQITYVIPVLISNLIANGIARLFTPSIYDLGIQSAKLPFLPDLLPSSSAIYQIFVEDFMVTDVKYVHLGMSYNDLKLVLVENKAVRMFPLVDNNRNMILLGSISRAELIFLIERQIGFENRTQLVNRSNLDGDNAREKLTFEDVRNTIFDRHNILKSGVLRKSISAREMVRQAMTAVRICDLPKKEQQSWEEEQMNQDVDFTKCHVDPAPFQLVERTSLLKVHSLFSMMSIHTAYVTAIGKLIGVVGVKELRKAIEDANNGLLPIDSAKQHEEGIPLMKK